MAIEVDVVIVGAGPNGLACGIEAKKRGFSAKIIDKGAVTESIRRFPTNMTFFSTPELMTLGDLPFPTPNVRPSRVEALTYYRSVVEFFKLDVLLHREVIELTSEEGRFISRTNRGDVFRSRYLIIATGYFEKPNLLNIPGEELPHVSHYYDEPYRYFGSRVVVVGGQNSAVETSLELYRNSVDVTLVHRGASLGNSVKYWVRPDIENRLQEGAISGLFEQRVVEITQQEVILEHVSTKEHRSIPADHVLLLTGYRPETHLLEQVGVEVHPETIIPQHNPETFETNVKDVFIAGSVACGCETGNIFIENGRLHAISIFDTIASR